MMFTGATTHTVGVVAEKSTGAIKKRHPTGGVFVFRRTL